jgi:hypothetical protein
MAREAADARSAWTSGAGSSCGRGSVDGLSCRWDRCSASLSGPTRAKPWSGAAVRGGVPAHRGRGGRQAPLRAARVAPRHALELAREGVPFNIIQRQAGSRELRPVGTEAGSAPEWLRRRSVAASWLGVRFELARGVLVDLPAGDLAVLESPHHRPLVLERSARPLDRGA